MLSWNSLLGGSWDSAVRATSPTFFCQSREGTVTIRRRRWHGKLTGSSGPGLRLPRGVRVGYLSSRLRPTRNVKELMFVQIYSCVDAESLQSRWRERVNSFHCKVAGAVLLGRTTCGRFDPGWLNGYDTHAQWHDRRRRPWVSSQEEQEERDKDPEYNVTGRLFRVPSTRLFSIGRLENRRVS
jgi:hypothetical protein